VHPAAVHEETLSRADDCALHPGSQGAAPEAPDDEALACVQGRGDVALTGVSDVAAVPVGGRPADLQMPAAFMVTVEMRGRRLSCSRGTLVVCTGGNHASVYFS
jgi:hypothetical protein